MKVSDRICRLWMMRTSHAWPLLLLLPCLAYVANVTIHRSEWIPRRRDRSEQRPEIRPASQRNLLTVNSQQESKTTSKGLHRFSLVGSQTVQVSGQWYRQGKPFHQLYIRQVTFAFRAARLTGIAPLVHAQLLRGIFHSDQEQYVSVFLNGSHVSLHLQLGVLHDRNLMQYTVDSDTIIKVGVWYVVCLCITERPTLNILKLQEGETQILDCCPKLQKASLGTIPAALGVLVDSGVYFGNILDTANMPGLASNAMIKPFKGAVYSQVWINRNAVDLRTAVCGSIPEEWRKQFSKIRLDQPIQVNRKSRNTNLTDETFQSFPVIGGVSGNHVREIEDMLSSVAVTMPKRGIIIYDIGMSNAKKIFLQSHCNVAVNRIRMDLFGDLVTHIRDYQWKALLVYSAFLKFDGVLFSDASIRYKHSLDELPLVRNGVGYIGMEVRDYSPAGAFTHDGMLEAFGVSRESVATSPTVIGGSHIWFKQGGDVASTVLTHLVACSMRKACIAPEGATLPNCNKTERLSGRYIGCHRFDQSAISVVTEKAFPKGLSNEQCLIEALNFIHVRRRGTGMYPPCIRNSSLSPELV